MRYPGYPVTVGPQADSLISGAPDAPIPDLDSSVVLPDVHTDSDTPESLISLKLLDSTQASTLPDAAQTRPRIAHSNSGFKSQETALHSQLAVFGFSVTNFRVPVASSVTLC